MGTTKTPQKTAIPQIVKLDKGMKLAEQWVNNMTKAAEGESTEAELEGRPSRVGLGAKVSRQSTLGPSNDPLEMKLRAKLNAAKRKAAKSYEESTRSATDGYDNDDDDEEDLGSRTTAFDKKRAAVPNTAILPAKKKQK